MTSSGAVRDEIGGARLFAGSGPIVAGDLGRATTQGGDMPVGVRAIRPRRDRWRWGLVSGEAREPDHRQQVVVKPEPSVRQSASAGREVRL